MTSDNGFSFGPASGESPKLPEPRLAAVASKIAEQRAAQPFKFDQCELTLMNFMCQVEHVRPSRTILIQRDGVTVERWSATLVTAEVITVRPGALGNVKPTYQSGLMGDALPRAYLFWQALEGGARDFHYLADIRVQPEFRRKGLGSWLLKQIIACPSYGRLVLAANARHFSILDLERFYVRHGFRKLDQATCMMIYDPPAPSPEPQWAAATTPA